MGLTEQKLQQFGKLGYVVKEGIYGSDDLQLLKDGLTGAIQVKCDQLIERGELDRDFAEESFETRLAELHRHNPEAATAVLMSIWSGRFHGPGILKALRHQPLIDCIETIIGPDIVATSIYRIRAKVPGFLRGEVPWHQDAGYGWPGQANARGMTSWLALLQSGGL